jgi:hypothetical protein
VKNLLVKEFRLTITWWMYLALGALLLLFIPMWMFPLAFGYVFVFFMILAYRDRTERDLDFVASLPVDRKDQVRARVWVVVLVELLFIVVAIPLCIVRWYLYPVGNFIGMNTNVAFFGVIGLMYAVFNAFYLPGYYSRRSPRWWPLGVGTMVALLVGVALSTVVATMGSLSFLNDRGLGHLVAQLAVLVVGAFIFCLVTIVATRRAIMNFSYSDL